MLSGHSFSPEKIHGTSVEKKNNITYQNVRFMRIDDCNCTFGIPASLNQTVTAKFLESC